MPFLDGGHYGKTISAMESSKKMGEFDSPNQNSNGNALARICEIFLTQNG
jgi:hypothetical protein